MTNEVLEGVARVAMALAINMCWNAFIVKLLGGWVLGTHITWPLALKAGAVIGLLGNIWGLLSSED